MTLTEPEMIDKGGNCYLFNALRKIAYREVLSYKKQGGTQADFYRFLLSKTEELNQLTQAPPLEHREYKHIVKSVAKWTWRNFNSTKFSQIQRARAAKRWQRTTEQRNELIKNMLESSQQLPEPKPTDYLLSLLADCGVLDHETN